MTTDKQEARERFHRMIEDNGVTDDDIVRTLARALKAQKVVAGQKVDDHATQFRAAVELGKLKGLIESEDGGGEEGVTISAGSFWEQLRLLTEQLTQRGARLPNIPGPPGEDDEG